MISVVDKGANKKRISARVSPQEGVVGEISYMIRILMVDGQFSMYRMIPCVSKASTWNIECTKVMSSCSGTKEQDR